MNDKITQSKVQLPVIIETDNPHNFWKVRLSNTTDKKVCIGLHWMSKEEATHEFKIDARKFWAAMDQLRGVEPKRK